jgi:acyl-coenzyme A thioesterase PaaI-like protein
MLCPGLLRRILASVATAALYRRAGQYAFRGDTTHVDCAPSRKRASMSHPADLARFRFDDHGVPLCPQPCVALGSCRLGITSERLDDDGVAHFGLTCPSEYDKGGGGDAHAGWAASVLAEMAGHSQILAGRPAHLGTLSIRFSAPVQTGVRLRGWALVDSTERRKVFVKSAIVTPDGEELVSASSVLIAIDALDLNG